MAIYKTTDTELTSIANAIRAKAGTSSQLVYPTGFVSAINGINEKPYNIFGDDLTLVETQYNESFALSTTDYPNITPNSSSYTTIKAQSDLPAISLSSQYDYISQTLCDIQYAYTNGAEMKNKITQYYFNGFFLMGKRRSTANNLFNNVNDTFIYLDFISRSCALAYNSTSLQNRIGNNIGYGVYASMYAPVLSGQAAANVSTTIRVPTLRVLTNDTYMNAKAFQDLDAENTIITITIKMWRCNTTNNIFRALLALPEDMCLEKNNIT